jgi:hypothetical protein
MATNRINWTQTLGKKWKHLDWSGLDKNKIKAKKAAYKTKAKARLDEWIKKELTKPKYKNKYKKLKYTIHWAKEPGKPVYYLKIFTTNPAVTIKPLPNGKGGTVDPPVPPKP